MLQYRYHGGEKQGFQGIRILADHISCSGGIDSDWVSLCLGCDWCQSGGVSSICRDLNSTPGDPNHHPLAFQFYHSGVYDLPGSTTDPWYTPCNNQNIRIQAS